MGFSISYGCGEQHLGPKPLNTSYDWHDTGTRKQAESLFDTTLSPAGRL